MRMNRGKLQLEDEKQDDVPKGRRELKPEQKKKIKREGGGT